MRGRELGAVGWAHVYTISVFTSGPVTAVLVVMLLTPSGQGLYYTLGSLVASLALFEFGSATATAQLLGSGIRERGRCPRSSSGGNDRMAVYDVGLRWNRASTVVFVATMGLGGAWLLRSSATADHTVLLPWFSLLIVSAAQSLLAPRFALLQANQQLALYWLNRVAFHWAYTVTLWSSLLAGLQLWSLAGASSIGLVWSLLFLFWSRRFLTVGPRGNIGRSGLWRTFRQRVWPLQWRLGLSWFSVTFALAWLTPITMHHDGALDAGRMGLTVTLSLVIFAFGTNWLAPDEPRFARLVASGDELSFRVEFTRRYWLALASAAAIAGTAVTFIALARRWYPPFEDRILAPFDATVLLVGVLTVVAVRNLGSYCRAHCVDPTAIPLALGSAFALAAAALLGTKGTLWVTMGYSLGMTGLALPCSLLRFKKLWIQQAPGRPS